MKPGKAFGIAVAAWSAVLLMGTCSASVFAGPELANRLYILGAILALLMLAGLAAGISNGPKPSPAPLPTQRHRRRR